MARVVHKFQVEGAGEFGTVPMPIGSEILHADVQGEHVFVWALVEQGAAPLIERRLGYFGTGQPVPEGAKHVGSCIERHWGLVWHVFEAEAAA
jgi:hypothetical protein